VRWIHVFQPKEVPRLPGISIDLPVLGFAFLLCVVTALLCGLAPALRAGRFDLYQDVKAAARGNRLRGALVASQLALSLVLLSGAGLLVRSFGRIQQVSPGFTPAHVLTFELTMTGRKYADPPTLLSGYRRLWERLDALPGVSSSGGITSLPFSQYFAWGPITVEGRVPPAGESFLNADVRVVSGRYFETMRIPLVRGRLFDDRDTLDNPRVALVDEFMARELWPGADPIGKRFRRGDPASNPPWTTVVGVVGRVKQYALDADDRIALYLSQSQNGSRAMYVAVRSAADPGALAAAVRREIRGLDPDLPVYHLRTMDAIVGESLAHRRFLTVLLSAFAVLALALAAIGIYGVMAYLVAQGMREIGIRMALGATAPGIVRLVMTRALSIAGAGVAGGLVGAFALTRFLRSLLFGVAAADGITLTAVVLVLAAIAVLASLIPARRAARVDPMTSLRAE
jgi:predicted permease